MHLLQAPHWETVLFQSVGDAVEIGIYFSFIASIPLLERPQPNYF
jgi:hypothetical protein